MMHSGSMSVITDSAPGEGEGEDNRRHSLTRRIHQLFQLDSDALELKSQLKTEGGLGEVWVGELTEESGTHKVAVKRYPSAFAEEEVEMFRRETGVLFMAASRCHNVCKVYGTAVKDDKMCIVMRLYKESMLGLMRRCPGGRLPLSDVRRYGGEICKAVAELHEQNIILQDLKPPNFLIDEFDHCVVADFGISKIVQGTIGAHMPSNVQGTFNYMSPEAFDPETFGGVSFKADSWSFACSLLEMITGKMPWDGVKMAPIVRKVMNRETPEIPQGLPAPLDLLLRRCFQFNPQIRPSFRDMYETFRTPWHVQGSGGDSVQSPTTPANDILRPVSGLFDLFRSPSQNSLASAGVAPAASWGGAGPPIAAGNSINQAPAASWGGGGGGGGGGGAGGAGRRRGAGVPSSWGGVGRVDGDEGGMGLAEENAKLSAEIERQRGELEKSRKLSDEVDRLTRENARLAEEADRRLALSMQAREDLEGMSSHADQESRILKSRLDKAVAEMDGLRGEKVSLEKLAEELAGERASLQAEKEDLQRAADEMKRSFAEVRRRGEEAVATSMTSVQGSVDRAQWEEERQALIASFARERQSLVEQYEEQRQQLESKVKTIEVEFDRAIKFEIQRMSGAKGGVGGANGEPLSGPSSFGSGTDLDESGSINSADMDEDGGVGAEDELELDEELLQCLGEKGGSGEAIAELASKAAQQGRPGQAEALCAAAYERYRERGNSALEAYRLTPPELRNLIGGGSEVAGGGGTPHGTPQRGGAAASPNNLFHSGGRLSNVGPLASPPQSLGSTGSASRPHVPQHDDPTTTSSPIQPLRLITTQGRDGSSAGAAHAGTGSELNRQQEGSPKPPSLSSPSSPPPRGTNYFVSQPTIPHPPSSSSSSSSLSSATKDRGVTSKSAPYDKPPPPYDHSSAPSSPFDRSNSPSVSSPSAATMYSSSRNQQGGAGAGAGAVGVPPSIPAPPPPHGQQSRASTLAPSNNHHNPAPSLLYASHAPQNGVGGGGVKIGVSLEGTTVSGVLPKSPAHIAGLREGDTILSVNKQSSARSTILQQLKEKGPDGRISVSISRGEAVIDLTIVLEGPLPLGHIDKRNSGREIAL